MFDGETARYVSIVAAFWVSLGSGTHYVYSAYGPQLAARLGFTATESSIIATLGSVGVYFSGPPAGVIIDRKKPHIPIAIGGCLILLGYMLMRFAFISNLRSVAFVGIWMIVASSGNTFAYHACVKCAAVNFPHRRGTATSFPIAGYGLSALFFSQIGNAAFPGDTGKFMLMLPLLTSGLVFVGLPFVRHIPIKKIEDSEALVVEEVADDETQALLRRSATDSSSEGKFSKSKEATYSTITEFERDSASTSGSESEEVVSMVDEVILPESDEVDIHGWALLRDWRFWIHFSIHGLLSGCGLMYILSAGYVLRALYTYADPYISPVSLQRNQAIQVSLVSIFSFVGRIVAGYSADKLESRGYQRMWVILASACFFVLAQIGGLTITSNNFMWFISIFNGFGYGVLFGSYASIISKIFGLKRFSENYGFLTCATVVGSDIFAFAFGAIYDSNSYFIDPDEYMMGMNMTMIDPNVRQRQTGQICEIGHYCYRDAFAITLPGSIIAVFLAASVIYYENRKASRIELENAVVAIVDTESTNDDATLVSN
ncbi:major facilitator superfamily domain-containing protein [Dipodascopsis uninucleata]